ncbi:MAG: metal-dependent hydrolase [Promethearchaeota archaeon]
MDSFTHIMVGIVVYGLIPIVKDPIVFYFAVFMASLPDLDVLLTPLQKKFQSYYLTHRGGSHSIVIGILVAALFAFPLWIFSHYSFLFLWGLGWGFYSLHLGLDLLTMSSIPFLYPFSRKEFKFRCERSVNIYLMVTSGLNFILFVILSALDGSFFLCLWWYIVMSILYGGYILHRIILKIWISKGLTPTQQFLPDLVPGAYGIYQNQVRDHHREYTIKHRALLFPSPLSPITQQIPLEGLEADLISIALKQAQNYRFFQKWEAIVPYIIPIPDQNRIRVVIILGESLSPKFAYFYLGEFDLESRQILYETDGFDLPAALSPSSRPTR